MALGDPTFGKSYELAVALNGELAESLRECVAFCQQHALDAPTLGRTKPPFLVKAEALLRRIDQEKKE